MLGAPARRQLPSFRMGSTARWWAIALLAAACAPEAGSFDGGLTGDAGRPGDAGSDAGAQTDAGPVDAGLPPDAGAPRFPAELLALTDWKLTLPVDADGGTSGRAREVSQPELATTDFAPWFTLNAERTAIVFRAHHGGATTSGSGNPRSELREMKAGTQGKELASWSSTVGTHTLWIKQAITRLTNTKPHTVAGQIHDANDDVTVFRLEGTNLYITDGNTTRAHLLTSSYALGTVFTVKLRVSAGVITYAFNEVPVAGYSQTKSGSGWYFKVGDYTQSNPGTATDAADAYAEVQVYDFKVTHQ
jgi:hypothetical protein